MIPRKRSLFLCFLIFSSILVTIYYLKFEKKSELNQEVLPPKVEVIERNVSDFSKKVYFLAKLHSNKSIDIMSETDGTIQNRAYQIGKYVKKGQIIIQMTDTRKILELKEIEDLLKASKARLDESSSNYKNSIKLHEKDIISDKEKETQWNLYRSNKFEYEAKKMRYKKVLWEFDNLSIRAPFDGYVNKFYFDVGQKVTRGAAILEFLDNNTLIGKANLSSINAEAIRKSNNKLLIKNKNLYYQGELLGIARQMSNDAPSYKLEFKINNKESNFIAGEVVEVEVVTAKYKNFISFPSSAIVMEDNEYFIFLTKDEIVKKIKVSPTQLDNKLFIVPQIQIPILHKIIINGQAKLESNDKIRINK